MGFVSVAVGDTGGVVAVVVGGAWSTALRVSAAPGILASGQRRQKTGKLSPSMVIGLYLCNRATQ